MIKTFVLIGGWTRSRASYQKLISSAPKGCKIIVIPHTIFGKTDRAKALEEYLSKNKIDRFNLVGHSLGGAIAIEYAVSHPRSIKKLYLIDSEGIYGDEKVNKIFLNFLKTRLMHIRKKVIADLVSFYSIITNPFLHFNLARYAHFANHERYLKLIKVPTIILWGEKDHITPVWQGKRIYELIKDSKLKILNGMDHDWILHSPQAFWQNL